jgi:hypothetical protein
MFRRSFTGTERDGALDNTVGAHEWGHYLHHRLAHGGQFQCGAMSEGWGDFIAPHTIARDGDNLNGTYALATYGTFAFDPYSGYFGIRRVPYSVDFTRSALTFKHIGDGVVLPAVPTLPGGANSEVHNAGEIWTTMLWEAYVALQKARGARESFDGIRRRMADYVVAGLKMAPGDATYTEQRDAILGAAAAAAQRDPDDDKDAKRERRAAAGDLLTLARARLRQRGRRAEHLERRYSTSRRPRIRGSRRPISGGDDGPIRGRVRSPIRIRNQRRRRTVLRRRRD